MRIRRIPPLLLSILIAQMAGVVGSIFTAGSIDTWYSTLIKPELNPPSWLFGPVWLLLYTLMGISAWLVWEKRKKLFGKKKVKIALQAYVAQLAANTLWSVLFFGLHNPKWAFMDLSLLFLLIILTMVEFRKIDKRACMLLIPYLLWVTFAGYLNYSIWQLNL